MDQSRPVDSAPEPSPFGDVDSDAELLKAFAAATPGSSAAQAVLTQIVARHGTMVYRVAQRMVSDPTLVDDVFQATFLVLAQSARKIQKTASLASWLHGTARNIGRRALNDKYGVRSQTSAGAEMVTAVEDDPFTEMIRSHERQLLDEELQQLPEIYRAPLVLHYFEQRSNQEISLWLGITVAAVESRLKRAKQLLRARLVRRGMTLSVAVAALGASSSLATATPSVALVSSTITLAATTPAITASVTAVAASAALQLAGKELATMSAASKITALLLTTAGTLTLGGAVLLGAVYGSPNGDGQGTVTASTGLNGIINTDAELGVLEQETQRLVLATVDQPAKAQDEPVPSSSKELVNSVSAPPSVPKGLHDEVAELSTEEESRIEKELQEKLLEKLNRPVTFNHPDMTLQEAARLIARQCEVTVVLGISKIPGINADSRVRLVANGETLASALRTMLSNVAGQKLAFSAEHGAIRFDSADALARKALREQRIGYFNRRVKAPFISDAEHEETTGKSTQADTSANQEDVIANPEDQSNRSQILSAIRNLSAAERKVYEALDQETSLDFKATPLGEVFEFLRTTYLINVWPDMKALEDEGVNLETHIDIQLKDVTLRTGLSLMLETVGDVKLDFYVDRGVLCITTADKAKTLESSRGYNFSGKYQSFFQSVEAHTNKLQTDDPQHLHYSMQGDSLTIETTYSTHRKIEDYIVDLVQAARTRDDSSQNTSPTTAQSGASGAEEAKSTTSSATASSVAGSVNNQADAKGEPSISQVAPGNGASLPEDSGSEHRAPILSGIRNLTAADRKVYEALDQNVTLDFQGITLQDVVTSLQSKHQLKIWVDQKALEVEGISLDLPVNAQLADIPLSAGVEFLLEDLDTNLDCYVDRGMLIITTAGETNDKRQLRFYDLSSGVDGLSLAVSKYVSGLGQNQVSANVTALGDCLAIEATFAMHKKIEEFIVGVMRVAKAREAAGIEFVIPKPDPAPAAIGTQPSPPKAGPQPARNSEAKQVSPDGGVTGGFGGGFGGGGAAGGGFF